MDRPLGVLGQGDDFRLIVDLDRVRRNLDLAIEELIRERGRYVRVDQDFYWQAEPSMDESPSGDEPMVASLVDDYENGVTWFDLYPDERRTFALPVLHHLGSLLSVLQEFDPQPAAPEDVARSGQA